MTSETIKLNLIPGGELPVLHASQFDDGRALSFEIYDGDEPYASYAAYNISLHLRKVDGTIIGIDTFTIDEVNDCVVFTTTEQMTACAGKNIGELVFTDSLSGVVVGSCNFILEVEPDPYAGGIDSASDIENLSTQIASIVDSQLNNYYTKEEIDDQIETIVTEQVTPIVSSIVAEQVPPAVQAELGNYYTKSETDSAFYDKSEVDILLSGKADTSDLPDMTNYYDKDTTDTLLASKANTSTTYTKTEVDNLIAAIPSNDITTEIDIPASVMTFNDGGDNIPLKSLVTEIVSSSGYNSITVNNVGKYHRIIPTSLTPQTNNGITVTPKSDGTFDVSGTATANSTVNFAFDSYVIYSDDGKKVAFNNSFADNTINISFRNGTTNVDGWSVSPINKVSGYAGMAGKTIDNFNFFVPSGKTVNGSFRIEFYIDSTVQTPVTILLGQTVYDGYADVVNGTGISGGVAFTFTGANIPTLSGENNIYTDVGDIQSLEYFNNKADDIAAMISLMTRS